VNRRHFWIAGVATTAAVGFTARSAVAAKAPENWDGLVKAKSKRLDLVYLAPGADFRGYSKVMLDTTEVAFEKDWRRDYNQTALGLSQRVSDTELQKVIAQGVVKATDLFAEACTEGGYQVVQEPGPDVLRLRTAIVNIRVTSPERQTAGRSYSFANEAGSATLVVEVRDSLTGALMGRAVDGRIAGDTTIGWRNKMTNRSDFRQMVKSWGKTSVRGLDELKSLSPINEAGLKAR
jgi:hypothetical protein